MDANPALSVYMPVYNAEGYLSDTIESVLSQTFGDFEFLVVDDGSTDRSAEIIRSFRDSRIRLLSQENQGCYPARNRAIGEARGEYLANMDAEDLCLPERFEKQLAFLEEHPAAVLVGTQALGCDAEDTLRLPQPSFFTYDKKKPVPHAIRGEDLRTGPAFVCATLMMRRSLVDRIGAYDTRLCLSSDVAFVAKASTVGTVACLPDALYVSRILPGGISGSGSMIQREIIAIIAAAGERYERSGKMDFTEEEVGHLRELSRRRACLPRTSDRTKRAFYETRIATLLRVNGRYREAMSHALRAVWYAPEHLVADRKLRSAIVKSGFGLRPG